MIESIFFNPWVWIFGIVLILCIAIVVADALFDWEGFGVVFGSVVFLVVGIFYFGFFLPPYDASFYQTYRITGQIEQVESAFSGDQGTMSQVFVAKVDGIDEFIRSDDQRFRTVDVGDDIVLVCDKVFGYFQEPYYDCSFGSTP